MTQNKLLHRFSKKLVGMAPQRDMPVVAKESFKAWFKKHPGALLWPDTFTNCFNPAIGKAAVEVLEALGQQVIVPSVPLCYGRPLYDYGFLKTAKKTLLNILSALRPEIRAGIPLIGLEPSCVAVFRDELINLLPKDEDARRLAKQSFMLGEFLALDQKDYLWPQLSGKALVQVHCHHKAVIGFEAEQDLLKKIGLDFAVMNSGCCGMSGSFGYEAGEHFDVSIKAAERVLFPTLRQAQENTLFIANGFSCQGQIMYGTGRKALHLAEVLQMALRGERTLRLLALH